MEKSKSALLDVRRDWPDLLLLGLYLLAISFYSYMNRDWGGARVLTTPLDPYLPFFPPAIFVYHLWTPTIMLVLAMMFFKERQYFREFIMSLLASAGLSFITFYKFTTLVPRPQVAGNDLSSYLVELTYQMDKPFCGFPSFHVLTTAVLVYFFACFVQRRSAALLMSLWGVLICLSTLLVKQHVVLDVVGGVLYAVPAVMIGTTLARGFSKNLAAFRVEGARNTAK